MKTVTQRNDGCFGSWSFTESRPGHFSGLVQSIWHFEGSVPYARERHLPNGLFELVVLLGD